MNAITLALVIIASINSALGLMLALSSQRQYASRVYAINVLTILSWIFCIFFYRLATPENIIFWTKALYASASLIASSFLFFTYIFPMKESGFTRAKRASILIPNVLIILLVLFGESVISAASVSEVGENHIIFGKLYFLYVAYILIYFLYAFYRLYNKYKSTEDLSQKRQALYLLTGYSISANIAFVTNLLLPWFGYFEFNWIGQVSTVTMVTFATYAIAKHQLFSIKAIATEISTGALWILLLIRTIVANTPEERWFNGVLLLFTIVLGVFLIRSVLTEVRNREKIERLALDLERANVRLKELDQQKSEFVSLASHQLRGPLAAVKGYASMLLDGDFGEIRDEAKDAIDKIYKSTQDLVVLVGDYLDVSRIEQGRMQYDFTLFDLKTLIDTVVADLRPTIEKAKLTLEYTYDQNQEYKINADFGKIKQVIGNLIDNSIKYTPKGSIHLWLTRNSAGKILISISDTGVGIPAAVLPRLFEKFTRAPDASKTNIMGTGLGLYVVHKMVEAHNGRVWAESPGSGKGSTFFIELDPADHITS
ncbi:MAG: ATP-binding protein [Patescibacteria group bacterium]